MYMACKVKGNVAAKPCAMPKGVIAEAMSICTFQAIAVMAIWPYR